MIFTKEKWKNFTAFCWQFFGIGSFWPILFILIFAGLGVFNSIHRYSQDDVDEIRIEYENEIESVREDSYDDGYNSGYDAGFDDALDVVDFDSDGSPSARGSHVVWVTPSGSKYHLRSCSAIRGHSVERTTIAKAEASGYTACSKCDP